MATVKTVLRGIKDGIRDEVLDWEAVEKCFDAKTLSALEAIVNEANEKRQKINPEDRRPWKRETPESTLAAQREAGLPGGRRKKVKTHSAEVTH